MLVANVFPESEREFSFEGMARWWKEWWRNWGELVFFGILVSTFFVLVVVPLFSLSETKLREGVHVMSNEQLAREVDQLILMIKKPVADDNEYLDVVYKQQWLAQECQAIRTVMRERFGNAIGYYDAARQNSPCLRMEAGDIRMAYDTFVNNHLEKLRHDVWNDLRDNPDGDRARAEIFENRRKREESKGSKESLTITIWHPEVFSRSYIGGMIWFTFWFPYRIKEKGLSLKWESPRLPWMILLWPGTFWYYPGSAREQAKEIKRWISYAFSMIISFCGFGARAAELSDSWKAFIGVSFQSSYVYGNGKPANTGPVAQPWVEFDHSSGVYVGSWASVGLEKSDGNEVDYSIGYRKSIGGVDLDLSYNYYQFMNGWEGMNAPKIKACITAYSLCGQFQYIVPSDGFASGTQSSTWWSHSWTSYNIGTLIGVTYSERAYGRKSVVVLKTEISKPIFDKSGLSIFARVYTPIAGGQEDNQGVQPQIGFQWAY